MSSKAEFIGGPKDGEIVYFLDEVFPPTWVEPVDTVFANPDNFLHYYELEEEESSTYRYTYCGVLSDK